MGVRNELLRMEQVSLPGWLDGFRLNLYQGEVMVLASLSGSRSEVIADILDGSVNPLDGRFWLDERPLKPREVAQKYREQLFRFRKRASLIPGMSIAENIFNIHTRYRRGPFVRPGENIELTDLILKEMGLPLHPNELIENLSGPEIHKLELIKAVALGARLIIVEDVWGGLPGAYRSDLFDLMKRLCDIGVTFMIMTQRHEDFADVMDRIVVFRGGRNFRTLIKKDYRAGLVDRLLISEHYNPAYEGLAATLSSPDPEPDSREVLRISELKCRHLEKLDFSVHEGEIFCLLDLQERGQEELMKIMTAREEYSGTITLDGALYHPGRRDRTAADSIRAVSFKDGNTLFENLSWPENLALMSRRQIGERAPFLRKGILRYLRSEYSDELEGLAADRPLELSGATVYQRRKLTFLKWIISGPKLLLCSKPCSEGDVLLREISKVMLRKAAGQGIAVLVTSSNPLEALACADRIAVLRDGRIKTILSPREFMIYWENIRKRSEMGEG